MTDNKLRNKYKKSAIPRACRAIATAMYEDQKSRTRSLRLAKKIKRLEDQMLASGMSPEVVRQSMNRILNATPEEVTEEVTPPPTEVLETSVEEVI